jgi:hypothetical protein
MLKQITARCIPTTRTFTNESFRCGLCVPTLVSFQCPCFGFAADSGPEPLTFPELVSLAVQDPVPPRLQAKLNALLTTPFIHNDSDVRPAQDSSLIHVAEWNINRGENEDDILLALTDASAMWRAFEGIRNSTSKS